MPYPSDRVRSVAVVTASLILGTGAFAASLVPVYAPSEAAARPTIEAAAPRVTLVAAADPVADSMAAPMGEATADDEDDGGEDDDTSPGSDDEEAGDDDDLSVAGSAAGR